MMLPLVNLLKGLINSPTISLTINTSQVRQHHDILLINLLLLHSLSPNLYKLVVMDMRNDDKIRHTCY